MSAASHTSIVHRLRSAWFIAALVLMGGAALAMQPAIAGLRTHYHKQTIDIRKPLEQFDDSKLTSFRSEPLPQYLVQHLASQDVGTDEWIQRRYVQRGAAPSSETMLEDAMTLITYYSDPEDSIPHTPEVCYRQDGAILHSMTSIPVEIPNLPGGTQTVQCRLLDLEQEAGHLALLYVFCCEGQYLDDREKTRMAIAMPGNRATYFAKIEAIVPMRDHSRFDDAVERAKLLMREALPVLVNDHLPTAEQISR